MPALNRMLFGEDDYYEYLDWARRQYFGFLTDGRATERTASFIMKLARASADGITSVDNCGAYLEGRF